MMGSSDYYPLVTCAWLESYLDKPDLVILDASMKPATSKGDAPATPAYLPGSRIFDIKKVFSDLDSGYPNTLPSPAAFEAGCRQLGIRQDSLVVVYDNQGIYSSPRAWWLFRTMGHGQVFVLDGGLPEWQRLGLPSQAEPSLPQEEGDFVAIFRSEQVVNFDFVQENVASQERLVVDARSSERFQSLVDEPRPGVRRGNIPHSINLPFADVLEGGKFKPLPALREVLLPLVQEDRPIVFSCASGVTACIVLLASELVFFGEKAIFDGSWTEWALRVK